MNDQTAPKLHVAHPKRPPLPVMPLVRGRAPARLIRYALRLEAQPLGLPKGGAS